MASKLACVPVSFCMGAVGLGCRLVGGEGCSDCTWWRGQDEDEGRDDTHAGGDEGSKGGSNDQVGGLGAPGRGGLYMGGLWGWGRGGW